MNWIILTVILLLLIPTGVLIAMKTQADLGAMLFAVGLTGALITGMIATVGSVGAPRKVNSFEQQKSYIESHIPEDSVENAALTSLKVELNKWLYDAQYSKNRFGNWSFYSDEIFDLQPIA